MTIIATVLAALLLALPVAAANYFSYRYFKALWLLSRPQTKAMIALGQQLQEMLREQQCASDGSSSRGTGLN